MAQVHSINGTTISYINQAAWPEDIEGQSLDIIAVRNRSRRHRWLSDVMPMSEYETLVNLAGTLATIVTTDPADRNAADYVTYYGVRVDSVTGRHLARNYHNVVVEFLARP